MKRSRASSMQKESFFWQSNKNLPSSFLLTIIVFLFAIILLSQLIHWEPVRFFQLYDLLKFDSSLSTMECNNGQFIKTSRYFKSRDLRNNVHLFAHIKQIIKSRIGFQYISLIDKEPIDKMSIIVRVWQAIKIHSKSNNIFIRM